MIEIWLSVYIKLYKLVHKHTNTHILLRDARDHCDISLDVLRQFLLLLELEGQGLSHLYTKLPKDAEAESVDRNSLEDAHGLHGDILPSCVSRNLEFRASVVLSIR